MGKRVATTRIYQKETWPLYNEGTGPLYKERKQPAMKTGIDRIAERAREEKNKQFSSLMHHINAELLWDNLNKIPKQSGVGVDKQNVEQAKRQFSTWSKEMIAQIHRRGYKPPPTKRVYIPKMGKTEKRPIAMPTTKDKALQKATVEVLSAIYEQDFLNCSFGGRPRRNAHQAIASLHNATSIKKVSWVFEADLENFFGSIDHEWVENFLKHRVTDPRIVTLIKRWLKAGVMEERQYQEITEGTPQGGPISVLISNIYLHYALDLWIEKVVKKHMKGEIHYIRYLDDFIVCFQYYADAVKFQKALPRRLAKFSLKLAAAKTRLIKFGRFAEKSSKEQGRKLQTLYFLGFTLYCTRNRKGRFKVGMKTEKKRLHRSHVKVKTLLREIRHHRLREQAQAINRILRGHYQYYGVGGNIDSLYRLYCYTIKCWRKYLSSRSQKGKLNWKKYNGILGMFPIQKPKLSFPYTKLVQLGNTVNL